MLPPDRGPIALLPEHRAGAIHLQHAQAIAGAILHQAEATPHHRGVIQHLHAHRVATPAHRGVVAHPVAAKVAEAPEVEAVVVEAEVVEEDKA